ncbi:MAG: phosphatidylserine decarboxylase, partial [Nitrospira sp.]|nr:phosphatidylserine decarboxylase [Nitrospira sp.]
MGLVSIFVVWFFRNPARTIPTGEGTVVSPGDGVVVAIESEFEHRFLKEPALRI